MRKIRMNNKGLSLVEVVMSALVVSVLMAGLYASYISAKNMASLALNKAVALAWVTSRLEAEKSGMHTVYVDPSANNTLSRQDGTQPGGYDRQAAIAVNQIPYGAAGNVSMRRVSVTVTWIE